jgi:hypothetical protein
VSFVELAKNPPSDNLCGIGKILAGLPDDEADALRGMLAAPMKVWPHTGKGGIQEALKSEGYSASDKVIRTHRLAACACSRGES